MAVSCAAANGIGDAGAGSLAEALGRNSTLQAIDLGGEWGVWWGDGGRRGEAVLALVMAGRGGGVGVAGQELDRQEVDVHVRLLALATTCGLLYLKWSWPPPFL